LHFYFLQQRHAEMLAACREAAAIEWVMVAPGVTGVVLPEYLREEQLVRLNLVAGRDAPEVMLDEWGIRCELTFQGVRKEVAFPWTSVVSGTLRPPERKKRRFGVIQGGRKD
jgi:stringent starvation protein B